MIANIAAGKELQTILSGSARQRMPGQHRLFAPQAVIEVRHRQHEAQLRVQLQQHAQQRDGIRATRHGDADAVAGAQQARSRM